MAGKLMKHEAPRLGLRFPYTPLAALRDEMEDMFSRVWGNGGSLWAADEMGTSLDLSETEKGVEVRMDLPGVKPDDIDIQVDGNLLTIRGERKEEREEKGRNYLRVERRSGTFARSVTLPCAVRQDEAAAEYRDGVLTVTLPKADEATAKKITVKS
jgi:HSP20 family protein